MKFVALISGGKDSFFNIYHCLSQGHELIALGNLHPKEIDQHEIDSFMFQTVGHDIIEYYASCLDVPLYRQLITGSSSNQNLEYSPTQNDEIEDLHELLSTIKASHPDLEAVSCGAILSHYQRTRVENVCDRLNLTSLAYLWQRDQYELMQEMCNNQLDARIIKVAAIGLNKNHLGKSITELFPTLVKLNQLYQVHICGEGGEFETMVFDCPLFRTKKLEIAAKEVVGDPSDDVYYLKMKVELVDKDSSELELIEPPALLEEEFENILLSGGTSNKEADNVSLANLTLEEHIAPSMTPPSIVSTNSKLYISNLTSSESNLEQQASDIFLQLKTMLDENNLTVNNIQHVSLLLSDMNQFGAINKVYGEQFQNIYLPPSRICIETTLLCSVQFSCVVLKNIEPKSGIHIRSRSYWGPQNIGPYSQSIVDNQTTYKLASLSGQIPLIPSTMDLSNNGINFNSALSLQHLYRVKNLVNVKKLGLIICFMNDSLYLSTVCHTWKEFMESIENTPENIKNLVVVKVSALPRGADVEWGGFSYEDVTGMYDDSDSEEEIDASLDNLIEEFDDSNICPVGKGELSITTLFTSRKELVDKIIQVNRSKNFLQVLASLPNLSKIDSKGSFESLPVQNVYNSKGQEFAFGLIWKVEN